MSTTTIRETFRVGGVLTDVTSCVFRDPGNTFGVRRTDTLAVVVAAGVALTHVSVGVYQYVITDPAANLHYNYYVEFVYAGETYTFEKDVSGGTGGGVAPATIPDALPRSCVSLARYAKITGYSECAINGVNNPDETFGECENPIWSQFQRDTLLRYLAEAQEEIEGVTGYPLCPTYFEDEEHPYTFPLHTRWARVLAAGVRAETDILASAAVDYTVEPAIVGPLATTVTDTDEVKVFYPDSDREIEPSRVTISGGNVTIYIPRCRLVDPDYFDTPAGGLDYTDLSNFLAAVDVKRVYTDSSVNASLVWSHQDSASACPNCGCLTCGEHTEDACVYVANGRTGALDILQASYAASAWTASCNLCYCSRPNLVRVSYLAGLDPLTLQAEDAVIRLAHAKLPGSPCGCGPLTDLWARDTRVPDFIDATRLANPFGPSDGSLVAFRYASAIASRRMSVL